MNRVVAVFTLDLSITFLHGTRLRWYFISLLYCINLVGYNYWGHTSFMATWCITVVVWSLTVGQDYFDILGAILTSLDALIKGEARGCSFVSQLLVDLRCEAFCHPVVVLGQVGIVLTSRVLGLGCHCCKWNRMIVRIWSHCRNPWAVKVAHNPILSGWNPSWHTSQPCTNCRFEVFNISLSVKLEIFLASIGIGIQ